MAFLVFPDNPEDIAKQEEMVRRQLVPRGIRDEKVLDAMRRVPRRWFVPAEVAHLAYTDGPLPIGAGQTISQPYIVAVMTQALCLKGDERVLEVGTGSGYQAAILGLLAAQVHTIEQIPALSAQARKVLSSLGYDNVTLHVGDGSNGLPAFAPYDAVVITAAAPFVSVSLLEQLVVGGILVAPVGDPHYQVLKRYIKNADGITEEGMMPVSFVPLRGEQGWSKKQWAH